MPASQTTEERRPEWRATTPLLAHQRQAIAKLLPSRVGALFMEMGTGKSRTAIELSRLRQAKVSRNIWFCPVTLKATIRREILKHTDCGEDAIYTFDDTTREGRMPLDRLWYIVGIESMSSSARALFCVQQICDERAFVIVDESTYIKGHFAKRTKRITAIAESARYRLVLTGTPITQGVVDLYAQMRFLSEKILGYKSFYTFARNHLIYSARNREQIVGSMDVEWLAERMKPYVYQVTKDECLSLPEKIYDDYYCGLSTEQEDAYRRAKEDFADDLLRYEDEDSDLSNGIAIFRLFSRLQGIACGSQDGRPVPHDRLDLLESVLADIGDTHIVIWTKYLQNLDEIEERLPALSLRVTRIDGQVPAQTRDARIESWKQAGGVLALTQGIGGHGLDLTAASTVIFYSSSFKYSEHIQAEDRSHRIGQQRPVTYISLWVDCGIEDRIRDALNKKGDALDTLRRQIDEIKGDNIKDRLRSFVMSL